jgi:hypothetical protein
MEWKSGSKGAWFQGLVKTCTLDRMASRSAAWTLSGGWLASITTQR